MVIRPRELQAERPEAFDRTLSRYISFAGLAMLMYWSAEEILGYQGERQVWWLTGHALLAVLFGILALTPRRRLSQRLLRTLWFIIPLLGVLLQATSFISQIADTPPVTGEVWETTWLLTPIYLCLLVLGLSNGHSSSMKRQIPKMIAVTALVSMMTPLGFLLTYGYLPPIFVPLGMIQFSNISVVLIFIMFRTRILSHYSLQERWEQRAKASAAAEARLHAERDLARRTHDYVLGALNSAAMFENEKLVVLPAEVVTLAEGALELINAREPALGVGTAVAEVHRTFVELAQHFGVEGSHIALVGNSTSSQPQIASVPTAAVLAIREAMSEALRNSSQHAAGYRIEVSGRVSPVEIIVQVEDCGPGFDLVKVPEDRLGIRESIICRMQDIPGGQADVSSAPGEHTSVQLKWARAALLHDISGKTP